jgi:hypothetical protein
MVDLYPSQVSSFAGGELADTFVHFREYEIKQIN